MEAQIKTEILQKDKLEKENYRLKAKVDDIEPRIMDLEQEVQVHRVESAYLKNDNEGCKAVAA